MKLPLFTLLVLSSGAAVAATVVQENFDYTDQDVAGLNGGTGWAAAWETGNSNATRRFIVSTGSALYQGGGNGTQTEQNRDFASGITVGINDVVTLRFSLIREETQIGRGIGLYLTNGGSNQIFVGKRINGGVGLHGSLGADTFATFASSGSPELITTVITYDGSDTRFVLSDSNETLTAYVLTGQQFSFDGISLAGYHGSTVENGVDSISIDVSTVPEPTFALLGSLGLLGLLRRRR